MATEKKKVAKKKATKKKTTKKAAPKKAVPKKAAPKPPVEPSAPPVPKTRPAKPPPPNADALRMLIKQKSELPAKIRAQLGGRSPAADAMESRIRNAEAALARGSAARIEYYIKVLEQMRYNG